MPTFVSTLRDGQTVITVRLDMDDPDTIATKILQPGGDVMRVTMKHAEKVAVKARSLAPVASGQLRDSIKVEQNRTTLGRFARGFAVTADVPYSLYVEKGRGPGQMPPVSAIRQWTAYKGIGEEAAFPIARAIGRSGTKAQPFMEPAINTPFTG